MSSEHDDSQNQSATGTDPKIMGEASSSSSDEGQDKTDQRLTRIPTFSLVKGHDESSSAAQHSLKEVEDATPLQAIPFLVPAVLAVDTTTSPQPMPHVSQQDKVKKVAEEADEAPGQNMKALEAKERLLKDACKSSRT
ncbi:hypothetical protein Fot_03529 [Forsythia ovata]|uniref:Uncharacterized protein n=1 Tax=Forsythia ovata TaxID=205694 RepID=A0ABD1XAU6_9LAMI